MDHTVLNLTGNTLALVIGETFPGRNTQPLDGIPLLAWTIQAAQYSRSVGGILLCTSDADSARVGQQWGAELLLQSPDQSVPEPTALETILQVLDWLDQFDAVPEYLLTLHPSTPFRTAEDIDRAAELIQATDADAVLGVCPSPAHPSLCYRIDEDGLICPFTSPAELREAKRSAEAYVLNRAIYLNRVESILRERTLFPTRSVGLVMPVDRSLDTDTLDDLSHARWLRERWLTPAVCRRAA